MKKYYEPDYQMLHSFIAEDQKMDIQQALKKLNSIVYHEEIGTLANKVDRVRRLTNMTHSEIEFYR